MGTLSFLTDAKLLMVDARQYLILDLRRGDGVYVDRERATDREVNVLFPRMKPFMKHFRDQIPEVSATFLLLDPDQTRIEEQVAGVMLSDQSDEDIPGEAFFFA